MRFHKLKLWRIKVFKTFTSTIEHLRIKMSDIKSERRFDDSMSSLSSWKYMVKLIIYIVQKCENIWGINKEVEVFNLFKPLIIIQVQLSLTIVPL